MKRIITIVGLLVLGIVLIACQNDTSITPDKKIYQVTFLDYDDSVIKKDEVEHKASAVPPYDPTREGYDFVGWDVPFSHVINDLTVRACYKIKTYQVKFLSEGKIIKEEIVEHNQNATPPTSSELSVNGKTFLRWSLDYTEVKQDLIIEAIYQASHHEVKFVLNVDDKVEIVFVKHNSGVEVPENPTKQDHVFDGWYFDETYRNKLSEKHVIEADTILYAKWLKNHVISFDADGGTPVENIIVTFGNRLGGLVETSKEGYSFDGWFDNKNVKFTENTYISGDVYLRAKWRKIHTISFETNMDMKKESVYILDGDIYDKTKIGAFVKTYFYYVEAWYLDEDLTQIFDRQVIQSDVVLYAKWHKKFYISFDSKGGSRIEPVIIDEGEKLNEQYLTPSYNNHQFMWWSNAEGQYDFNIPPKEDMVLYAVWAYKTAFYVDQSSISITNKLFGDIEVEFTIFNNNLYDVIHFHEFTMNLTGRYTSTIYMGNWENVLLPATSSRKIKFTISKSNFQYNKNIKNTTFTFDIDPIFKR